MDDIERLVPADAAEGFRTARTDALQRMQDTAGAVHEFAGVMSHFVADHASGVAQRVRTAHLDDPLVFNRHRQTTSVRAIERANAGVIHDLLRVYGLRLRHYWRAR